MAPIDTIIDGALRLVNKFVPDKMERERIAAEIEKAKQAGDLQEFQIFAGLDSQQIEVNKIEAANPSLFVSGWRPALGWICVIALGMYYIPRFLFGMAFWCVLAWKSMDASIDSGVLPIMPEMGVADIIGLVTTMLGSSLIRMHEKTKNVARV